MWAFVTRTITFLFAGLVKFDFNVQVGLFFPSQKWNKTELILNVKIF